MARGYGLQCANKITEVCQIMESTLFEGTIPSVAHTRHGCGSACAITDLLREIAREHHGAAGFITVNHSLLPDDHLPRSPMIFVINFCDAGYTFQTKFQKTLDEIRDAFLDLPADLRLDMLTFFLERTGLRKWSAVLLLVDEVQSQILPSPTHAMVMCASVDFSRLFAGNASGDQYDYVLGLYKPFSGGADDESVRTVNCLRKY